MKEFFDKTSGGSYTLSYAKVAKVNRSALYRQNQEIYTNTKNQGFDYFIYLET